MIKYLWNYDLIGTNKMNLSFLFENGTFKRYFNVTIDRNIAYG